MRASFFCIQEILLFLLPRINDKAREILNFQKFSQLYGGILFYLVGEPINLEKKKCISNEDIDQLHEIYMRHLKELFEKYKNTYTDLPDAELEII